MATEKKAEVKKAEAPKTVVEGADAPKAAVEVKTVHPGKCPTCGRDK